MTALSNQRRWFFIVAGGLAYRDCTPNGTPSNRGSENGYSRSIVRVHGTLDNYSSAVVHNISPLEAKQHRQIARDQSVAQWDNSIVRFIRRLAAKVAVTFALSAALMVQPSGISQAHVLVVPTLTAFEGGTFMLSVRAEEAAPLTEIHIQIPQGVEITSSQIASPWKAVREGDTLKFSGGYTAQLDYVPISFDARATSVGVLFIPYTLRYANGVERPHDARSPAAAYPAAIVNVVAPPPAALGPHERAVLGIKEDQEGSRNYWPLIEGALWMAGAIMGLRFLYRWHSRFAP